jgi:CheY-like chemotaxis protein
MELTCKQCRSKFKAAVSTPLTAPVRVKCPSCGNEMVLKPKAAPAAGDDATLKRPRRTAVVADEPRPFRSFLGEQLQKLGFAVEYFDTGDVALQAVKRIRPDLVIVNVYLKGKLGVEVTEEIKADPALTSTHVILIGALFRANRFRANPTNLYGADEYIEEQIPEKEFRQIIRKLFPEAKTVDAPLEPQEFDEARRLARLILSDIIIYHAEKVERAIRDNSFFEVLHAEIEEGRKYYESRVSMVVRRDSEIFTETLQQFVQMKREELRQESGRRA